MTKGNNDNSPVFVRSQDELSQWLGVGERQIRNLTFLPGKQGRAGYNVQECVLTYIRHLQKNQQRGKARIDDDSGEEYDPQNPGTINGINLSNEEARKARLTNDKLELQVKELARKLAPVHLLGEFTVNLVSAVSAILDSVPGQVKRRNPKIPAKDLAVIKQEIIKAQNAASRVQINLDQYQGLSEDD